MKIQDWMARGRWEQTDRHWYLRFSPSSPHRNLAARFSVIYLQPGNYHLRRRVPVEPLARAGRPKTLMDATSRHAPPGRRLPDPQENGPRGADIRGSDDISALVG